MSLFFQGLRGRRVILNTKTQRAFRGIVVRRSRGEVTLREAQLLREGGAVVPLDGEVMIPAQNVDFLQVVP